jgi:hypothetical protein
MAVIHSSSQVASGLAVLLEFQIVDNTSGIVEPIGVVDRGVPYAG